MKPCNILYFAGPLKPMTSERCAAIRAAQRLVNACCELQNRGDTHRPPPAFALFLRCCVLALETKQPAPTLAVFVAGVFFRKTFEVHDGKHIGLR